MNDVPSILTDTRAKMAKAVEHLESEYSRIRTGRASTSLVKDIKANYYGSPTPLQQMANIAVQDARTIAIRPWDASALKDIEKAILASDLGITPTNDGKVIRLTVPPLTGERRQKLVAEIRDMAEQARVSIRNIRRDSNKFIDKLEKKSDITEDDQKKAKDDVQELTDYFEKKVNEIQEEKKEEVMEV